MSRDLAAHPFATGHPANRSAARKIRWRVRQASLLLLPSVLAVVLPGLTAGDSPRGSVPKAGAASPDAKPMPPVYQIPGGELGCAALTEAYCDALWSPTYRGNLRFDTDPDAPPLLLGRTPNDIDYALWFYYRALLDARSRLPPDLAQRLAEGGYFRDLGRSLETKPLGEMSLAERERYTVLLSSRTADWSSAVDSTVRARVSQKNPGYHRLRSDQIPTAVRLEAQRENDRLHAAVHRAVWENHPLWKRVQADFAQVRDELLRYIAEEAPPALRPEWTERITSIKLVIPGTDPERMDIDCAKSTSNAFYSPDKNTITVCAGLFVGGGNYGVIAHEMSHALGVSRSVHLHKNQSQVGQALAGLRDATCRHEFSGCAAWETWKRGYPALVAALGSWVPQKEDDQFLACFQNKTLQPALDAALVGQIAKDARNNSLEAAARQGQFLMLTKEEEILRDGSRHPNPGYLDPCGQIAWYPLDFPTSPALALTFFYVNEYRCQKERSPDGCMKEPEKCLRAALDLARDLSLPLTEGVVRVPGRYSSEVKLQREKMAEDVGEDSADAIGERVVARLLARLPDVRRRRAAYLGTWSLFCDRPSLTKLYPREALAQKDYYFEPHAQHSERRKNLLIAPIRKILECTKDFAGGAKECAPGGTVSPP